VNVCGHGAGSEPIHAIGECVTGTPGVAPPFGS
jgi:hypothetical protein